MLSPDTFFPGTCFTGIWSGTRGQREVACLFTLRCLRNLHTVRPDELVSSCTAWREKRKKSCDFTLLTSHPRGSDTEHRRIPLTGKLPSALCVVRLHRNGVTQNLLLRFSSPGTVESHACRSASFSTPLWLPVVKSYNARVTGSIRWIWQFKGPIF